MAITSTITGYEVTGMFYRTYGTYTDDGGATGDIVTGLSQVVFLTVIPNGASAATNATSLDETMTALAPLVSTDPTIDCDASQAGYWEALGYL